MCNLEVTVHAIEQANKKSGGLGKNALKVIELYRHSSAKSLITISSIREDSNSGQSEVGQSLEQI